MSGRLGVGSRTQHRSVLLWWGTAGFVSQLCCREGSLVTKASGIEKHTEPQLHSHALLRVPQVKLQGNPRISESPGLDHPRSPSPTIHLPPILHQSTSLTTTSKYNSTTCRPFLNASRDSASTTSPGSPFQCITTLVEKKCFLTSNLNQNAAVIPWAAHVPITPTHRGTSLKSPAKQGNCSAPFSKRLAMQSSAAQIPRKR